MDGLSRLLGHEGGSNPPAVGLLLADSYAPASSQYGLMFDIDGGGSFGPRQGCAVFLAAIKQAMPDGAGEAAFNQFVAYTAIHELGHAFNLWHVAGTSSFMQPHPDPANPGSCSFDPSEAHYLGLAANPNAVDFVLPGPGRSHFGTRPHGFPSGDQDHPFEGPSKRKAGLAMKIALSHDRFWSFEPVELDVELNLLRGQSKAIGVLDEIDPGYPSFQIWITRPDGERFRYRPQSRFCYPNGKRLISRAQPFRRDISICRQTGGYTFATPGRYQVQAALRLPSRQFVISNAVECEVLPADPESTIWTRSSALLQTFEARRLLRYKRRPASHSGYAQMAQFADDKTTPAATGAAIHYALGKAFVRSAESELNRAQAEQMRDRGAGHLRRALDHRQFGRHRTESATALLEMLKTHAI